jgi:hypothetical protein
MAGYERLARINERVLAALEADAPGPELAALLSDHGAAMAELEKEDACSDAGSGPARLEAALRLKSQVDRVLERLERKSRDLAREGVRARRTQRALRAYAR